MLRPVSFPTDHHVAHAQDFSRSDRMDEACDAMRLNGLVRSAIRLVRGVEIAVRDGEFKFAVCSVIPWFKVT